MRPSILKRFFKGLVDILYPPHCLICQNHLKNGCLDNLMCPECWMKIKRNSPPFCSCCGRHLEDALKDSCRFCQKKDYYFDRAFSPCVYEGIIKELIHQFKYVGKDYLGSTLGRLLVEFINEYGLSLEPFDFIIPVPLYKRKLREREFNQAEILAEYLASEFKLALLKDALLRIRDTPTQTELSQEERSKNVKGCFLANPRIELKNKNVLLVDDLLTTGSTCSEAARALKNARCGQVVVFTLAS